MQTKMRDFKDESSSYMRESKMSEFVIHPPAAALRARLRSGRCGPGPFADVGHRRTAQQSAGRSGAAKRFRALEGLGPFASTGAGGVHHGRRPGSPGLVPRKPRPAEPGPRGRAGDWTRRAGGPGQGLDHPVLRCCAGAPCARIVPTEAPHDCRRARA